VQLYGHPSAAELATLKRRLETMGELEFRIMASEKFAAHKPIIEVARKLVESDVEVRQEGVKVAQWAAINPLEFLTLEEAVQRGLVMRMAGTTPQALMLLNDGLDVTGAYFKWVAPDLDERGSPQLSFAFDARGAFLFGQLSGDHLPTATGQRYNLGIVLDGTVMSAPTIESKITDRARISGNMKQEEVEALAAILKAGHLPSAVKLVSEKELK